MPKGNQKGNLAEDIGILFNDCQKTFSAHKRSLATMNSLYEKQKEEFMKIIIGNVNHLLLVFKRDPGVERLVQLMISFSKENTEFGLAFLRYLLELSQAKDKAVRFRVCQFVAGIIGSFTDDVELDDALWARIIKLMLIRTKDKVPTVRIHAVAALRRFQDPQEAQDPVISEYVRLMQTDSCKDVRKAAVLNVGIFKTTIGPLIKRTRDSKEDVRKAAYTVLSEKVKLTQLSIAQRLAIVREGMIDRSDAVKAACVSMITKQWLECVSGDPVQLLKLLDIESAEEVGEKVLVAILTTHPHLAPRFPADEAAMLSFDAESALFLGVYCQRAKEQKAEQKLDELLPEILKYCELLRAYTKSDQVNEFVLKQMLDVAQYLDLADEVGRRSLADLQRELLISAYVSEDLISMPIKILRIIYPNESAFLMIVLELLAETKEPLEMAEAEEGKALIRAQNEELVSLAEKLKTLELQKKTAVKRDRLEEAAELKKQIETLTDEHSRLKDAIQLRDEMCESAWHRCLSITEQLLLKPTRSGINSGGIAGLAQSVILPCIQSAVTARRKRAMLCMGLYCLLSEVEARKFLPILMSAVESDADEVKEVALRGLADVIMAFGFEEIITLQSQADSTAVASSRDEALHKRLVTIFAEHLDHELESVRTVAVEAVAKLMMLDELQSAPLFSHLVVLFFNPMTEDDALLRQCLSVFFSAYVFSSAEHTGVVEESFGITLQTIINAPARSPLKKIPLINVAQFLISITDPVNALLTAAPGIEPSPADADKSKKSGATHERLGVVLAQQVLADNASSSDTKALCKCLGYLQPTGADPHAIKCLRVLTKRVQDQLADTDKTSVKVVEKLMERLKALDATPDVPLSAEEQQKLDTATQLRQATTKKPTAAAASKAKAKPRGKAAAASRKKKYSFSEEEEEEEEESNSSADGVEESDDEEAEEKVIVKKPSAPVPTTATASSRALPARSASKPIPKKVLALDEEDEEEADDEDEEDEVEKEKKQLEKPKAEEKAVPQKTERVERPVPPRVDISAAPVAKPAAAPPPAKALAKLVAVEQDSVSSLHNSDEEEEEAPKKEDEVSKPAAKLVTPAVSKSAPAKAPPPVYKTVSLSLEDSDDEKPLAKLTFAPEKPSAASVQKNDSIESVRQEDDEEKLSPPRVYVNAPSKATTAPKASSSSASSSAVGKAPKKPTVGAPVLATSVRSISKPKPELAQPKTQPTKASARPALAELSKQRAGAPNAKPSAATKKADPTTVRKPPVPTAASSSSARPKPSSGLPLTTPKTKLVEAQRMNDEMSKLLADESDDSDGGSSSSELETPKENVVQKQKPLIGTKNVQTARIMSEIEDMLSD